eukprot:s167_g11.t2
MPLHVCLSWLTGSGLLEHGPGVLVWLKVPPMSNAGSTAPRPRAQAHSSWLLAASLAAVVLRSFSGVRITNFVGAPNQLPLRAQVQSSDALQARNDGWYMMPLGVPKDACEFGLLGSRASQEVLDLCASELLEAFGLGSDPSEEMDSEQQTPTCFGIMRGLGSQFGYANNTRRVCWETPNINLTSVSCEVLNSIAWEMMVLALRHLALCSGLFGDVAEETHEAMADEVLQLVETLLSKELELQDAAPTGLLMGDKLRHLRADLVQPLQAQGHTRQVVSRLLAFGRKAFEHSNWMVWRDTHFLWLQDSLREGRVVHTAWGPSERWEELGANDAHAVHSLVGGMSRAPAYGLVNEGSQRQDILQNLLSPGQLENREMHKLAGWAGGQQNRSFAYTGNFIVTARKKLHQSRGGEQIHVVEIGVFKGSLSKFLLEKLPFVTLLGIDPYIGTDGTFPGDFSETMDPDFALSQAASIYENYKDRAQLLPAIFVDGCHLYECVDSDLQIWLPKLSGAGALVAGHDFSPQWPGR